MTNAITVSVAHEIEKRKTLAKKPKKKKSPCEQALCGSFLRLTIKGIQHSEYFFLLVGWKCFDSSSYPGTFNLVPVINYIYEHLICRAFKGVDDCSKLP